MSVETTLASLRDKGWAVAVHNDYSDKGIHKTFWLFTHPLGVWAKGEGSGDEEALRLVERQIGEREGWMYNVYASTRRSGVEL